MKEDQETGAQFGSMREQYRRSGVRMLDLGQPPMRKERAQTISKIRAFTQKVRRLKAFIRQEEVDVLDVHLAPANPLCAVATLGTNLSFVVTLYQLTMPSAKHWLTGQFNLGRAACLITDSNAQASRIRKSLLGCQQIRVIPNGTFIPQSVMPREKTLNFLNIPNERGLTIVGQISSLLPYKGHMVLLEAAKRTIQRHPECLFLMIGYEREYREHRESLLRRAAELGIAERVRISGYPGPIGDVWNIIDIHAHASLLDSLPNALLEAMSLGKASVITSVGGIPEAINHGGNGFLVQPGNPDELARCLLRLLDEPSLRHRLGEAAQATYRDKFRPELMAKRLEECFEAVLGSAIK